LQGRVIYFNIEKKIISKLNTFIYKPRYEKMPKTTQFLISPPIIPTQQGICIHNTAPIRDNRSTSIVSGRLLSEHVDKFAPNQGIVNTTYLVEQPELLQPPIETEKIEEMKVDQVKQMQPNPTLNIPQPMMPGTNPFLMFQQQNPQLMMGNMQMPMQPTFRQNSINASFSADNVIQPIQQHMHKPDNKSGLEDLSNFIHKLGPGLLNNPSLNSLLNNPALKHQLDLIKNNPNLLNQLLNQAQAEKDPRLKKKK
jgi:hypothetical protein